MEANDSETGEVKRHDIIKSDCLNGNIFKKHTWTYFAIILIIFAATVFSNILTVKLVCYYF